MVELTAACEAAMRLSLKTSERVDALQAAMAAVQLKVASLEGLAVALADEATAPAPEARN
jgi:hypothetical protein